MENKTIEALEKLVAIKDETIKELEKQIQLLRNQPLGITLPYGGTLPYTETKSPLSPPYTITCESHTGTLTTTGDNGTMYTTANTSPYNHILGVSATNCCVIHAGTGHSCDRHSC